MNNDNFMMFGILKIDFGSSTGAKATGAVAT